MESISDILKVWKDTEEVHRMINETLTSKTNGDPKLKEYRDWIESNIFGFGERSFLWMWKLLVDEMPSDFKFLEIGVFRGQVLALIRMLSNREKKDARIIGITPLDSTGGHWESDYESDIKFLHDQFNLSQPEIIKGLSTDYQVIGEAARIIYPYGYNMLYIDGGHEYEVAKTDIINFSPMVKVGGYLVIDDCANKYDLPCGYFRGIESVSRAVDEHLPNDHFTELFNVMHNRVFQRVK